MALVVMATTVGSVADDIDVETLAIDEVETEVIRVLETATDADWVFAVDRATEEVTGCAVGPIRLERMLSACCS